MKYIKLFERYFDEQNAEPTADDILDAFDNNDIQDFNVDVEIKPTYRHDSDTKETTYTFKTSKASYEIKLIESETRGREILIKRNGRYTDIDKYSKYREEILSRCEDMK